MGHNPRVVDHKSRISELAELMEEFRLSEASLTLDDFSVAFYRKPAPKMRTESAGVSEDQEEAILFAPPAPAIPEAPRGTPISSPMTGIYYASPNPSSPNFVKEGDTVTAGQIIGLIEAMKVFNEIPSPISGTVLKVVAENGQLVQPGEPLILIG
jgi:acetyl-CoA carboxylase biotin carboxyl carrier protein